MSTHQIEQKKNIKCHKILAYDLSVRILLQKIKESILLQ